MSEDLHDLFARVHGVISGPGGRDEKLGRICEMLRTEVGRYDVVWFALDGRGDGEHGTSGSEIRLPLRKAGAVAGELVVTSREPSAFTHEDRQFLEGICTFVSGIL